MAVLFAARNGTRLGLAILLCVLPALYAAPMFHGDADELSAIFNVARTRRPEVEQDQPGSSRHASPPNESFRPPPSPAEFGVPQASSDVFEYHPDGFPQYSPGSWVDYRLAGHGTQQGIDASYPFAPPHQGGHDQARAGPSQLADPFSQLYLPLNPASFGQREEWSAMHPVQPDGIGHQFQWDHNSNARQLDTSGFAHSHPSQPTSPPGQGVEVGSQAPPGPNRGSQQRRPRGRPKVLPIQQDQLRELNQASEQRVRNQVEAAEWKAFQRIRSSGADVADKAQLDAYLASLSEADLQALGREMFSDSASLQEQGTLLQARPGNTLVPNRKGIRIATTVQRALYQALLRKAVVNAKDPDLPDATGYRMESDQKIAVSPGFVQVRNEKWNELLQADKNKRYRHDRLPVGGQGISIGPYTFHVGGAGSQLFSKSGVSFPVTAYPKVEGLDTIDMGLLVIPSAKDHARIYKAKARAKQRAGPSTAPP